MVATSPTYAGYLSFVRNQMGISTDVLPDDSPTLPDSYQVAVAVTNPFLAITSPMYTLAVYNFGGDYIINWAQDVPNAPVYKDGLPYFQYFRKEWKIFSFVAGVIQSSGDEGTNQSMVVPKSAENYTLSDLQNLKTPYGRQYLAIAQKFGTLWGLS